jgi:hypothetical protein
MALEASLDRVQRWMQSVVVHPGSVDDGVAGPDAVEQIPAERVSEVILPSATLTPVERVGIYHSMYLLRMEEALESDYPGLQHFLGYRGFRELVEAYVQTFPSRSYTLNRLGDHLPEFVKTAAGLSRREFCHDLARLELLVTEAFDAPETPCLSPDDIAAVAPEAWERARLAPISAFRMGAFRYPVSSYLDSLRGDDHDHPKPRQKDSWVAAFRHDYRVRRVVLTRPAFDLLSDLVAGQTLGEAVTAAMRRGSRRGPKEDELFRWFRDWMSGGMFQSVRVE